MAKFFPPARFCAHSRRMPDEPEDSERPRDEAWWESELHRNEKLMDKYMAVLGDHPDWDKWQNPDDLYNKVHFNIDPPGHGAEAAEESLSLIHISEPTRLLSISYA